MAAPLPGGFNVNVVSQAPRVDPNAFAPDVLKSMQVAQAGLHLSQELANLTNQRALRELDAAKIDAAKSKNKLDMLLIDHATENLPKAVEVQLAEMQRKIAESDLARMGALSQMTAEVPVINAAVAAQGGRNALAGLNADAAFKNPERGAGVRQIQLENARLGGAADIESGYSALSTPDKAQLLKGAETFGAWGVKSGDMPSGETPNAFRKTTNEPIVDQKTGNTILTPVTVDSRNGRVLSVGEGIGVTKLGADEKSVASSVKEMTSLVQTRDLAETLKTQLKEYGDKKQGGLWQAVASNAANSAPTGMISVMKKAMGSAAQSEATVKIVGAIQNLKNVISNELFGAALTKEENANLQGQLPTSEDLADPKRAMTKLTSTISFLDTKLSAYLQRGALQKSGLTPAGSAPAAAAPASPAATGSRQMDLLKAGGAVRYDGPNPDLHGKMVRLGTGPDGRPALVLAQ